MVKTPILVYAEPLLARSMTFVREQGEALTFFSPYYISPHYLHDGLPLPKGRVLVMRRGGGFLLRLTEVPFKVLGVAPLFVRRLRRLRPALLHAHFGFAGLRALPLARSLDIPLIVSFHGCDATQHDEFSRASSSYAVRSYFKRRKMLEKDTALMIAVSDFIREEMVRKGFSRNRIVVHYVGVDTETFKPDLDIKRESIVLFTGRLEKNKGCEFLIQAMIRVQDASPDAELVVIGDGSLRVELEQLACRCLRRYRFLGFQTPDVVRYWMNRARVFAAPSVRVQSGESEGYGIVFAEAQAMGLPVVSFAAGGIPEAVVHGRTGFLAPERDVEGLAHFLQKLCAEEDLRTRMGEAARAHVCAHFDLRAQTKKLEELYKRVLQKDATQ